MEYVEESTQIFTSNNKLWIRKRTDPLTYIILFFGTLTLAFTGYWAFMPIAVLILFGSYSIKRDLIFDFEKGEIQVALTILRFLISKKQIALSAVQQLRFVAERRGDDENMYKPFMYYLHVKTSIETYRSYCYFESKQSVKNFSNLIKKYTDAIPVELDMNGLEESEKFWNG